MSRVDRFNRTVLAGLGLLLLAAGIYVLVRSYGGLGDAREHTAVLLPGLRRFVGSNLGWFWLGTLIVVLLVAFAGLSWVRMQLRAGPAVREVRLNESAREGRSVLDPAALESALSEDIASYAGITGARSKLRADGAEPEVDVRIDVEDYADIASLRQQVEAHALRRLREALEVQAVLANLRFDLSPAQRRVR